LAAARGKEGKGLTIWVDVGEKRKFALGCRRIIPERILSREKKNRRSSAGPEKWRKKGKKRLWLSIKPKRRGILTSTDSKALGTRHQGEKKKKKPQTGAEKSRCVLVSGQPNILIARQKGNKKKEGKKILMNEMLSKEKGGPL